MGRLRGLANELHASLAAELQGRTGIDNGYRRCGALEFRSQHEGSPTCPAGDEGEHECADQSGWLSAEELHLQEPALAAELTGARWFPEACQVRNPWHLRALIAGCTQLGVRLLPHCPALQMVQEGGRITNVVGPNRNFAPEQVVIASGAWTDSALRGSGQQLGVRPIRGQMLLLKTPRPLVRRMLLAGHRYVVPREDGRTLVGSTEEDVGFEKATTAEAIAALRAFAEGLVPGFAQATEEARWSGLRPMSLDRKPILGRAPGLANLFLATGHHRSGLQLSTITGMVLAKLLTGQEPGVDLKPFGAERFRPTHA